MAQSARDSDEAERQTDDYQPHDSLSLRERLFVVFDRKGRAFVGAHWLRYASSSDPIPARLEAMLSREEYVEQAHFFEILRERIPENIPLQELLPQVQYELLASTNLPMAVSFLATELKHSGCMHPAMLRLTHYFEPFQAYTIAEAESERGRFDMRIALHLLQAEAHYRAEHPDNRQGLFFFQFECLSRNRLHYDRGLEAMSRDSFYDESWRDWILRVRRDLGLVDLADLVFQRSQEYIDRRREQQRQRDEEEASLPPPLFGKKEGRIALANRRKDPLFLFAAMQRHLGYPAVPRPQPPDPAADLVPQLARRLERLETRIKLMEDEQRQGGIDLTKFYQRGTASSSPQAPE